MKLHKFAHKSAFTIVLAICVVVFISFARQKTNAYYGQTRESAPDMTATTPTKTNKSGSSAGVDAAVTTTNLILSGGAGNSSSDTKATVKPAEKVVPNQEIQQTPESIQQPVEEKLSDVPKDPGQVLDENKLEKGEVNTENPAKESELENPQFLKESDLPKEKNPKLFGKVDQNLSIVNVELVNTGNNPTLSLKGKAFPNSILQIYLFSDPIIITVNSDANGNWNYDLSKEVENGKHEAYVVVTDNSGRIMLKSDPVAFIKTAQAATMIPYSELNKSPIEKTTEKYVLIAILIIGVCLAIAVVMMIILIRKQKINETAI